MQLFNRTPNCHERGICQRTTPQCRRVCHLGNPSKAEQTIGYESAPASNVHQLHSCKVAAGTSQPVQPEEAQDRPADSWDVVSKVLAGGAAAAALLVLVGLVLISLQMPDSWLHQLGWAAMHISR